MTSGTGSSLMAGLRAVVEGPEAQRRHSRSLVPRSALGCDLSCGWSRAEPGAGPRLSRETSACAGACAPAVFRAYESVDAWLFRMSGDPLEPVDLAPPRPSVQLDGGRNGVGLSSADFAKLSGSRTGRHPRFRGNAGRSSRGSGTVRRLAGRANRRSRCFSRRVVVPVRARRGVFRTSIVAERESERSSCTSLTARVIRSRCIEHVPAPPGRAIAAMMSRLEVLAD